MKRGVPTIAAAVRRFPIVSLLLASFAAAIESWPGASLALQLDRAAFVPSEAWRILTCHFTHFGFDHFLWDVLVLLILGSICERIDRRRMLMAVGLAILAIPPAVMLCLPEIGSYRGLSGIDSALFGVLAVTLIEENIRQNRRIGVIFTVALLIGFMMKVVIEMTYGVTVFADSAAGGFVPVPLAHFIGLAAGATPCCIAILSPVACRMGDHDAAFGNAPTHRRHRAGRWGFVS